MQTAFEPTAPFADRGIYTLGPDDEEFFEKCPFVRGGRVLVQWADLELSPGHWEFGLLDKELEKYHRRGRKATVQVNGLRKPTWLYEKVAVYPQKIKQIADSAVLQYWDPVYKTAYLNFIEAYARHLKNSPYRNSILGIRQNFNAIGTELGELDGDMAELKNWKPAPNGRLYDQPWSRKVYHSYKKEIIDAHISAFCPEIFVFVRNNVFMDNILNPEPLRMIQQGQLGLFHTSTEHQPRSGEAKYHAFLEYCRTGKTIGYAEGWTSIEDGATGGAKVQPQPSRISPCQLSYWRNLLDLHCGVSCIAIRSKDLLLGEDEEFARGFEFANRYVGFHASPETSPGAWVAMREGDTLQGDYTFLMHRLEECSSDYPLYDQGPLDQRFGGWARGLNKGERMVFALEPSFAQSLTGAIIRIVYLDCGVDSFSLHWDQDGKALSRSITKENTGRWRESEIKIHNVKFFGSVEGGDLALLAEGDKSVFHMVEVTRI